jgi:hypothetical protein
MEKLRINMCYKFIKGGSRFYAYEGDKIKIKLENGSIISGTFCGCNSDGTKFQIEDSCFIDVNCDDVVDLDIMAQ